MLRLLQLQRLRLSDGDGEVLDAQLVRLLRRRGDACNNNTTEVKLE